MWFDIYPHIFAISNYLHLQLAQSGIKTNSKYGYFPKYGFKFVMHHDCKIMAYLFHIWTITQKTNKFNLFLA
jgi:hypothetical protein